MGPYEHLPQDIEAGYCEMAADQVREREALEWYEGVICAPEDGVAADQYDRSTSLRLNAPPDGTNFRRRKP